MRLMIALALLGVATLSLSACNTVDGLGKDMETAGRSIQNM